MHSVEGQVGQGGGVVHETGELVVGQAGGRITVYSDHTNTSYTYKHT